VHRGRRETGAAGRRQRRTAVRNRRLARCALVHRSRAGALALAEAATRLADREDPVPDAVWEAAARHFDDKALSALLLWIGLTNLFNRVNVATRLVAGTPMPWEQAA
jgi:alkylhydroperoxidase family enzyme